MKVRREATAPKPPRQAPLKLGPATDTLISQGAHFLGSTKKDLVAEAVRVHLDQRREDLRTGMVEALNVLDGSLTPDVMLMTGLTAEEIEAFGGINELPAPPPCGSPAPPCAVCATTWALRPRQ
ncbi:hypothetical protein ACQPZG_16740 [Streptomyces sp. CA-294286]|uniref:hypothetical protein n=1 Tax=Streptomyces sp. CA-294286 TaxID=3240070 RepID=UPI003D90A992